jgi:hypothetical protein
MTTEEKTTEELNVDNLLDMEENIHPTSHKEIIETVIAGMEENDSAMVKQTDAGYLWKFQYGTVEVFVQLTGESDDDLLTVWSAVLNLPANNEPELMRELLEMNWSGTFETCFGIFNNQIVVLSQRTVAELSPGEIARAITLVATIADDNDEKFQEKYGS